MVDSQGPVEEGEDALAIAKREFAEETGFDPQRNFMPLGSFRQPGGKIVHAWAVQGDIDPDDLKYNTYKLELPPRSGRVRTFREVDRAAWFGMAEARSRILHGQRPFLRHLVEGIAAYSLRVSTAAM